MNSSASAPTSPPTERLSRASLGDPRYGASHSACATSTLVTSLTLNSVGPRQRLVRVQRRLSLQAGEAKKSDRMADLCQQPPKCPLDVRMQELTDLVVAAGTDPAEARKALKPATYSEIVREAGALNGMGSGQAEVVWSACSSLAHGDLFGMLSVLDRTIVGSEGDVALAKITSSPKVLCWATDLAVEMLHQGFALFKDRAACHR